MQGLEEHLTECLEKITARLSFNKDNEAKILLQQFLVDTKLDSKQIAEQTLPQLNSSLENINIIIDKFEKLHNSKLPFESMAAIQYLPTLLERKKLIVDRTRNAQSEREITSIVSQAAGSNPIELKKEIENLLEKDAEKVKQSIRIELAREQVSEELIRMKEEREAFKEKWEIRKSFLEKEPVTTLVGALLILVPETWTGG